MDQQVLIKIEGHHKELAEEFYNQLENKEAVDVTVAVIGGYIKAHRVILSMSSPYFKELLTQNPDSYPVVMLREVEKSMLALLLEYIYRGEVKLSQVELNNFLRIGAMLQIKGLTAPREEPGETEIQHVQASTSSMQLTEPKKKIDYAADWMPAGPKREPLQPVSFREPLPSTSGEGTSKSVKQEKEPDIPYRPSCTRTTSITRRQAQVECQTCRRCFANNYNLKIHTRDKHTSAGRAFSCELCLKPMRNASCLRVHMYHHRKLASLKGYGQSRDLGITSSIGI